MVSFVADEGEPKGTVGGQVSQAWVLGMRSSKYYNITWQHALQDNINNEVATKYPPPISLFVSYCAPTMAAYQNKWQFARFI